MQLVVTHHYYCLSWPPNNAALAAALFARLASRDRRTTLRLEPPLLQLFVRVNLFGSGTRAACSSTSRNSRRRCEYLSVRWSVGIRGLVGAWVTNNHRIHHWDDHEACTMTAAREVPPR